MTDTSTSTDSGTPEVVVKEVPVGLSKADLEEHAHRIRNEMQTLHDAHTREQKNELEALKEQLKLVTDELAEQRKAQQEKDEHKGDGATIVTPPADLQPQQTHDPADNPTTEHDTQQPEGRKKGGWKRAW